MLKSNRVMKVECYFSNGEKCSDRQTENYLEVNSFGYFKKSDSDIRTYREKGRADYQIIYIKSGCGDFYINQKTVRAGKGDIVIIRPFEKNSYIFYANSDFEYYWIHFAGSGVSEILHNLHLSEHIYNIGNSLFFEENFFEMVHENAVENFTLTTYLAAKLMLILTLVSKNAYALKSPVGKVIELMQKEKINKSDNDKYAKMCGFTTPHFIREFKKTTKLSPHKYKTKIVINKAIVLFETTALSVSAVAKILGFDDGLYFSRVFKKETGLSPKKYIEKNIKNKERKDIL